MAAMLSLIVEPGIIYLVAFLKPDASCWDGEITHIFLQLGTIGYMERERERESEREGERESDKMVQERIEDERGKMVKDVEREK
jgi:hypothetical protein